MTRILLFALAVSIFTAAALAQPAPSGCKAYFRLEPLDARVVNLLATPLLPPNPGGFLNADLHQLVDWDLPSKVTPWRDRPSRDELARKWEEFDKKWTPHNQDQPKATPSHARPYGWRPLSSDQWKDLEKWFAKEAPKKIPGLCLDATQATYVLSVGIVSGGSAGAARLGASNPHEYEQLSAVRQQDAAVGPNAATYSPTAHESRPDELNGMDGSSDPSAHTCTYLYRTTGAPAPGTAMPQPDLYYCHSAGEMPRSAVGTMLKYLAKTGLP